MVIVVSEKDDNVWKLSSFMIIWCKLTSDLSVHASLKMDRRFEFPAGMVFTNVKVLMFQKTVA